MKHLVPTISYSAYRDYKSCPALFYYRKVLRLKLPEEPLQLVFGKSLHYALEMFTKEGQDPVKVFEEDFSRDKLPDLDLEKFITAKDDGLRLLEFWKENQKEMLKEANLKVSEEEVRFKIEVDEDPLTKMKLSIPPITGVIDFITADGALGDYKTSSKKYTQEMVDTSDQPTFYYLAYYIKHGKLPKAFYYIVFRKNIKRVPVQILQTQRTMTQISQLLGDIQEVITAINNREFSGRHEQGAFCDCWKFDEMLKI